MGSPRFFLSQDGIEDGQELSHAGDEGDLFSFSSGQQVLIVFSDHGIMPRRSEGGHVQGASDRGASPRDHSPAAGLSTVTVEGRQSHQRGDLLSAGLAEFREFSQECPGRRRPDAFDGQKQLLLFLPDGRVLDVVVDVIVDGGDLAVEQFDDALNALAHASVSGLGQSVGLGDAHLDQLPSACEKFDEYLCLFVVQGPQGRLDGDGKEGQDLRVDRVGLGKATGGLCKVADLSGVDDDHRQSGSGEFSDDCAFIASGRFEDDARQAHPLQRFHDLGLAGGIVVDAKAGSLVGECDIEPGLGDVDADGQRRDILV